ncbi:AAA family ATPase [Clostridium sp.]|uniref:AAA family ATPase n=1 Tax=Clostridium sp. TaxID=1506 RepID=UPI002623A947|nr:AAA family ATPase [Clostridium sp.]
MKLLLKSFAKIKLSEIRCDGITIIAGENNTGKSTIGKTLFSLFNSIHNLNDKIENERKKQILLFLRKHLFNLLIEADMKNLTNEKINIRRVVDRISSDVINNVFPIEDQIQTEELYDFIYDSIKKYNTIYENHQFGSELVELVNKIDEILKVPNKEIELEYISRYFQNIFYQQINSVIESESESIINLTIKDKIMELKFKDNKCVAFDTSYNILNNAFYIDNPFVLDELNEFGFIYNENVLKSHIVSELRVDNDDMMQGVLESVSAQQKLLEIYSVLNDVVDGNITKSSDGNYYYSLGKLKEQINVNNLSTGLKSFILIKMLLEKGSLKDKDVLILDEPEIHLHPQWQIYYAELIVLLQKQFDLTIIITTHSPYFIDAIEVFSAKHNVSDRVNYYLSDISEDYSVEVKDVTNSIELIYKKLAEPMQYLESLRNGIIKDE